MSTIVTKIAEQLLGRPSAAKGGLWSLGLHAAALAVTYSWWSSPVSTVSFAGSRHVVQIEATFAEVPADEVTETELAFETTKPPTHTQEDKLDNAPPLPDLAPQELPHVSHEIAILPAALQRPDEPRQDNDANNTEDVAETDETRQPEKPRDITPPEPQKKTQPKPSQPPAPEAAAVVEQLAGIEERAPADLSANRPPVYPREAIRRGLEGVVMLRVHIAASGRLENVEVAKSSGHAILDRTAKEAVSTWRGQPAEENGRPVGTVEILPVRFRL